MARMDATLATFLEGDGAQNVATVDASGEPSVGRAWGLRVHPDGIVRAIVGADTATTANLTIAGRIAVVVTDVATYRSVQVKGAIVGVEPATAADHGVYARYQGEFTAALLAAGRTTPMDHVWPAMIVAVKIEVDAVFDQTPGPGAGLPVPSTQ